MTETMWSFILAAGSIGGLWIVSKKPTLGWAWTLIMEFLWITYAALIKQWGFMTLCICYAIVYTYNLYKARRNNVQKNVERRVGSTSSFSNWRERDIAYSSILNNEINDGTKTRGYV